MGKTGIRPAQRQQLRVASWPGRILSRLRLGSNCDRHRPGRCCSSTEGYVVAAFLIGVAWAAVSSWLRPGRGRSSTEGKWSGIERGGAWARPGFRSARRKFRSFSSRPHLRQRGVWRGGHSFPIGVVTAAFPIGVVWAAFPIGFRRDMVWQWAGRDESDWLAGEEHCCTSRRGGGRGWQW